MSTYTNSYAIRYTITSLQQQTETAVIHAATDILVEDPSTPDHSNRILWASWAQENSVLAYVPFMWPVALNPTIEAAVAADPTGGTVADTDVQFVVNSELGNVIPAWIVKPPPGAIDPSLRVLTDAQNLPYTLNPVDGSRILLATRADPSAQAPSAPPPPPPAPLPPEPKTP